MSEQTVQKKITKQEAFDRVWDHFVVKGNKRSVDEAGECVYRCEDGSRCAVGLFIPDEKYSRSMEGLPAHEVCRQNPEIAAQFEDDLNAETFGGFLYGLQRCHDKAIDEDPGFTMEARLRRLAAQWNLTIPSKHLMPTKRLRPDYLGSVNSSRIGKVLMTLLNDIQGFTPEEQAASAAALSLLVSRKFQTHISRLHEVASNILEKAYESTPEIRAAIMYVEKEL